MEVGKLKISRMGQRGDPGRTRVARQIGGPSAGGICSVRGQPLALVRPSPDWVSLQRYGEPSVLLKLSDVNDNLIQKHPRRHIQNSVWAHYLGTLAQPHWHIKLSVTSGNMLFAVLTQWSKCQGTEVFLCFSYLEYWWLDLKKSIKKTVGPNQSLT